MSPFALGHRPLYLVSLSSHPADLPLASAGRIHSRREHARVVFYDVWHRGVRLQAAVRLGTDAWETARNLAVGDWLAGEGRVEPSRTGEPTWWLDRAILVNGAERPLEAGPELGRLPEQIWLERPAALSTALVRSRLIAGVRAALAGEDFVEVDTPILQADACGAAARPFSTRGRAWERDLVLRVAPEPALIRLLIGGWDRVFEIGRCFRNEGVSPRHHPEFTLLEAYEAFVPMARALDRLDALWIAGFAAAGVDPAAVPFQGQQLDFTRVARRDLREMVAQAWGTDDPEALRRALAEDGVACESAAQAWLLAFERRVEPALVQPTAVCGWPEEVSPLAAADGGWARRFEVYAAGMELANGYEQETDRERQRARFARQAANSDGDVMAADAAYLDAMAWGMPPLSGFGVGMDRWVQLAMDAPHIRDAIVLAR